MVGIAHSLRKEVQTCSTHAMQIHFSLGNSERRHIDVGAGMRPGNSPG